jgi:predicted Holliday junction resolvase-like endonuclease
VAVDESKGEKQNGGNKDGGWATRDGAGATRTDRKRHLTDQRCREKWKKSNQKIQNVILKKNVDTKESRHCGSKCVINGTKVGEQFGALASSLYYMPCGRSFLAWPVDPEVDGHPLGVITFFKIYLINLILFQSY